MHGGSSAHAIGTNNGNFVNGRHSRFLPAQMAELYEDALTNPDLLDMSDHIALLEARIQSVLNESADGDPAPRWSEVNEMFDQLTTDTLQGKSAVESLEKISARLQAGMVWDRTWDQVTNTMEQLRKVADTEVKRRKELNMMVPIERVVILMASVARAVKRNVTSPAEIDAVMRELASLHGSNNTSHGPKAMPEVIDISPESRGVKGGRSREARRRKKNREIKARAVAAEKSSDQ
jgi:hypothetical protein